MQRWLSLFVLLLAISGEIHAVEKTWNVVLILADDLGWTDLGCYGSDFYETPNIDQLARDGMRFTQNYSACTVCSPTRAALLTGKSPARLHITDWIPGLVPDNPKLLPPDWTKHLPLAETTLAERFRSAGYTTACIGKWHLGTDAFYPEQQGFDVNIAGTDKPQPSSYFAPWKILTLSEGKEGDYLTDRLAEEAVRFLDSVGERPFFLYCPHFAVHTPIQARKELVEKFRGKLRPGLTHTNAAYAAMLASLDDAVGRVRDKLVQRGLADRTIIVFTSDNGGRVPTTSNRPLRVGKASAYEGGVRVPLIVHWPSGTAPGVTCTTPVITMDLFPTLLEMCGLEADSSGSLDGASLVPLLRQTGDIKRTELYWHYPHHQHYQLGGATPYSAIRSGDYKLIEFFNDNRVELYHLGEDIGELQDLAAKLPDVTRKLHERLHAWRREIGAQMPTPNPRYDATRPEYTPPPAKKAEGK